jgi:hypothetical protein
MALFDITAEDVARGTLVKPGWYSFTVKSLDEKPAKQQKDPTQSVTVLHVGLLLDNAKNDEGADVGPVPVKATFPSNAPSMIINFANAFGAGIGKEGKKIEVDDKYIGKRAKVYIKRGQYEGRVTNNCDDFMKL